MNRIETFYGKIETRANAEQVFGMVLSGQLKSIGRRLYDHERREIRSGSVFVYEEEASNIRRWTDGVLWSPSRMVDGFLFYRELMCRTEHNLDPHPAKTVLTLGTMLQTGSDQEIDVTVAMHNKACGTQKKDGRKVPLNKENNEQKINRSRSRWPGKSHLERYCQLEAQKTKKFVERRASKILRKFYLKPNGFIKKTFSSTKGTRKLRLVCYYRVNDICPLSGRIVRGFPHLPENLFFSSENSVEFEVEAQPRPGTRKKYRRGATFPGQAVFQLKQIAAPEPPLQYKQEDQTMFLDDIGDLDFSPFFPFNLGENLR